MCKEDVTGFHPVVSVNHRSLQIRHNRPKRRKSSPFTDVHGLPECTVRFLFGCLLFIISHSGFVDEKSDTSASRNERFSWLGISREPVVHF